MFPLSWRSRARSVRRPAAGGCACPMRSPVLTGAVATAVAEMVRE